ncbi:ATP-binding protein [Thiocystis violacea]|uniref:ATP-binding protein n=1 Tax=Thiocystis violacea TaxID=13725 RepID=UPI001904B8C8|nr:ATP-binding protein [Thiocystis violacea]
MAALVCLAILVGGGYVTHATSLAETETAQREARLATDALAKHTRQLINDADALLHGMRWVYRRTGSLEETERYVNQLGFDRFAIGNLYFIGPRATIQIAHSPEALNRDVSDREYVRFHMDHPADVPFISVVETGRVTGDYYFRISRRVDQPDGSFGGVVLASLDPRAFAFHFSEMKIGVQSTVALLSTRDHKLRARIPEPRPEQWAQPIESPLWAALEQSPVGIYETASAVDGVRRLYTYRQVDGLPLLLALGFSAEDIDHRIAARIGWLWPTVTVVMLLFLTLTVLADALLRARDRLATANGNLLAAVQHLRAHMDNSPLAVIELDAQLRFVRWSSAAEPLFGWTADEVLGRRISDIAWVYPPDVKEVEAQIADMLNGQQRRAVHLNRHRRRDGVWVDCLWHDSAIYDRTGKVTSILFLVLDVTEREASKAALEAASRHKDEFLATLAHELRNPLAPLRTGLEILRLTPDDPHMSARALSLMERQLGQLVHLVDDLLDLSRISQGRIQLQRRRVPLADSLYQAVETTRTLIDAHGHRLDVSIPDEPLLVEADPVRLTQIFANLLSNAAKYTEDGGHLQISVAPEDKEAVVRVTDNGLGIAPDLLPRVFDLFVLDHAGSSAQDGLGIGLHLVQRLVAMHGGQVEAQSAGRGQGSAFIVRLPLTVDPVEPDPPLGEASTKPTMAGRRILIVDDNQDAADSLGMMLTCLGHTVWMAYDGLSGLSRAAAFCPEVILLDLGMPSLDGYETAKRLRAEPWGQNAILIALTGWSQEEDRQRTHAAGFDHHWVKPVAADRLANLLAAL